MMRNKFSTSAIVALTGLFAFTGLMTTSAQAGHTHWFYSDYNRYDDRAYEEEYYEDEDEYIVYAPRSRRAERRLKRERLRRRAIRRNQRAARRANRLRRQRNLRQGRQRLDDARRNGHYTRERQAAPRRTHTEQPAPRKRLKLAYVPLPRTKPYHLLPTPPTSAPTTKVTLDRNTKPAELDQRPVWKATPAQKPKSKKEIQVAKLPAIKATKPAKTQTTFKPIRIEVVKKPAVQKPVVKKLVKAQKPKPRKLAKNQLSCDKAKSIVSGFGFSDVSPKTCTGKVYDFNAKRDGKPYSVKVSSLSGELKGVKKIK